MSTTTQSIRPGAFLLNRSRQFDSLTTVTLIATTVVLEAGTVLGIVTSSGKWGPYSAAATDGRAAAKGILYAGVPVSTSDQRATVVARDSEVSKEALFGLDAAAIDQLRNGKSGIDYYDQSVLTTPVVIGITVR